MRTMTLVCCLGTALIANAGVAAADYRTDLAPEVKQFAQGKLDQLLDFYLDLHRNPELSLHENQSHLIAERLQPLGDLPGGRRMSAAPAWWAS